MPRSSQHLIDTAGTRSWRTEQYRQHRLCLMLKAHASQSAAIPDRLRAQIILPASADQKPETIGAALSVTRVSMDHHWCRRVAQQRPARLPDAADRGRKPNVPTLAVGQLIETAARKRWDAGAAAAWLPAPARKLLGNGTLTPFTELSGRRTDHDQWRAAAASWNVCPSARKSTVKPPKNCPSAWSATTMRAISMLR